MNMSDNVGTFLTEIFEKGGKIDNLTKLGQSSHGVKRFQAHNFRFYQLQSNVTTRCDKLLRLLFRKNYS